MKTQFATKKALTSRTPTWAKNMFRITMLLTTVAMFIVASDTALADNATRIMLYLKGFDMFMFGISKMFGVTEEEDN